MSKALLITMHDEVRLVLHTLARVRQAFDYIGIVQSGPAVDSKILTVLRRYPPRLHWSYRCRPNLFGQYSRWELPAQALCRNYGVLFKELADGLRLCGDEHEGLTHVVAITGDTGIINMEGIEAIIERMDTDGAPVGCAKAYGCDFHSADKTEKDLRQGRSGGRLQEPGILDFMPQFFVVSAAAVKGGLFSEIPVTNRWCSEQCLGDAMLPWLARMVVEGGIAPPGQFAVAQFVISPTAYGFGRGIAYHARVRGRLWRAARTVVETICGRKIAKRWFGTPVR